MKQFFVTTEIAQLAKQNGFDLECVAYKWDETFEFETPLPTNHDEILHYCIPANHNRFPQRLSIPTHQQLCHWFSTKYDLDICVEWAERNALGVNLYIGNIYYNYPEGEDEDEIGPACDSVEKLLDSLFLEAFEIIQP